MRVIHVLGRASFGGIARLVMTLVKHQIHSGAVEPAVLLTTMHGEYLQTFRDLGAQLLCCKMQRGWSISFDKYRKARKIFEQFEVIHFHYFNPFLVWCAVKSGRKIVYTEHGNFGFGRKKKLSDPVKKMMLKWFLNKYTDFLTFNSEFTAGVARKRYGLEGTRQELVYNGVDHVDVTGHPERVDSVIRDQLDGKYVIGTSSRFAGFKRIDRLLEGFALFLKQCPHSVLLLVGDGVLRGSLEQLAGKLGILDQVVFAGFRENVSDYQSAMNLCVFPSENEPFGLVAVETLLLGKPVLVFRDGGGLVEIIGGIEAQDIVDDVEGLCDRMLHYHNHNAAAGEVAGGRGLYAARFNAVDMEIAFREVYQGVISCAA